MPPMPKKLAKKHGSHGFTLVEMLVVAPLVVLVIGTFIGLMVSLVQNALTSSARTQTVYDIQDSLNMIEQDVFKSTAFVGSYTPASPQGKNDGTAAFTSSGGDLIFNEPATDKNPSDAGRQLVYYANTPTAVSCSSQQIQLNQRLYTKAIYFTKVNGSTTTLYRRTIVPPYKTTTANQTCATPWQRNTCTAVSTSNQCVTKDVKVLDNVSGFSVTYYNKGAPTVSVSDPTAADSVRVSLSVTRSVSGNTINNTLSLSSSRLLTVPVVPDL